ncbi:MAG: hypothetical protein AB1756_04335 [Acidobacteriota bacterium]
MNEDKKEYTALKVLSGIVMVIFLIGGIFMLIARGKDYERFLNQFIYLMRTGSPLIASGPITIILFKTVGAFLLMWAFFLFKLFQEPVKNAIIASGSGIGFIIISAVTVTHFFSDEIVSAIPPYIIAIRVLVTAIIGLLFLIWTPKR